MMPIGHGNRIEKPPTEKQRAQAKAWNTIPAVEPSAVNAPDRSWWIGPQSREEFDAVAAEQAPRMKASTFGQGKQVVVA
jgi:hypothetical protein